MPETRTLSHSEARRVYDLVGKKLDSQAFYEDRATDAIIRCGDFPSARSVFEFGCGTGRFAARLLREHLPETATYRAIDQSTSMVRVARTRLEPFGDRAEVVQTDGEPSFDPPPEPFDRFKPIARGFRKNRELILNWFRAHGTISAGAVEGLNNKLKLTTRKAYGYRSFKVIEIALYHALGHLPQPHFTHKFW